LAACQQRVRPECTRSENDAARGEGLALLAQPGARSHGLDEVAIAAISGTEWADVDDLAFRQHRRAVALGEPQVILDQRVLCTDPAANHAGAAARAAGPLRASAAEVRVGDRLAGLAEIHADRRARERVLRVERTADFPQQFLVVTVEGNAVDTKHALCRVV